jgi:hypothetical protein
MAAGVENVEGCSLNCPQEQFYVLSLIIAFFTYTYVSVQSYNVCEMAAGVENVEGCSFNCPQEQFYVCLSL